MQKLGAPIDTRPLFRAERQRLLNLLTRLGSAQWGSPTICPGWSVADVANHLIGDDVGRLARSRDGSDAPVPQEDVPFPMSLHRLNEEWVVATRRFSHAVILDLLEWTGEQIAAYWGEQDLLRTGEQVSWAGPGPAPVWLDAARDFGEYWLHRQQILDAVSERDDTPDDVRHAVYSTLIRAVPHALHDCTREDGSCIAITLTGAGGGTWSAVSSAGTWAIADGMPGSPQARVVLSGDVAWRIWTRGVEPSDAPLEIVGDEELGNAVREMVSIIR